MLPDELCDARVALDLSALQGGVADLTTQLAATEATAAGQETSAETSMANLEKYQASLEAKTLKAEAGEKHMLNAQQQELLESPSGQLHGIWRIIII